MSMGVLSAKMQSMHDQLKSMGMQEADVMRIIQPMIDAENKQNAGCTMSTDCMNGGICDTSRGVCVCVNNFSGSRCQLNQPATANNVATSDTTALKNFLSQQAVTAITGSSPSAQQCMVQTDQVLVQCGSVVSITLDRDDACLSDQFVADTAFASDITAFTSDTTDSTFSANAFSGQTSFGVAVRGTRVRLEVVAADQCNNLGSAWAEPALECESIQSGKCCPAIAADLNLPQLAQAQAQMMSHGTTGTSSDPMTMMNQPLMNMGLSQNALALLGKAPQLVLDSSSASGSQSSGNVLSGLPQFKMP